MSYPEIYFPLSDPNREGWLQADRDMTALQGNWHRLSRIVFTDLVHETGLYDELKRGQRAKLERNNEHALNPELPLTRSEARAANRGHVSGFPLWSIPILAGASAIGAGVEAAERYSKTGKPGSSYLTKKFEHLHKRMALDSAIRDIDDINEGIISRLAPEIRVGSAAVIASQEPTDYVVNMTELLEAAEAALLQDGTTSELERIKRANPLFTKEAPRPLSVQDQRSHAAEVFMGSSLLRNGELGEISLERQAIFLPDGENTFRISVTTPYAHLYEGMDLTGAYEPSKRLYADTLLDPDPITELLRNSQV